MNITIKCPNCFQQVSNDNRFCIFCGYDLKDNKENESKPVDAILTEADKEIFEGHMYCPKGHNVSDPSLGFCPVCGSPLVGEPVSERAPEVTPANIDEPANMDQPSKPSTLKRVCRCGYVCDDPDLSFCPSCGLPFEAFPVEEEKQPDWKCACGTTNPFDMNFCVSCGRLRGWRPSEPERETETEKTFTPAGMKPPTDNDLTVKARYGN